MDTIKQTEIEDKKLKSYSNEQENFSRLSFAGEIT